MKTSINKSTLKASIHCAAKNDAIVYVTGHRTANLTFQGFIL